MDRSGGIYDKRITLGNIVSILISVGTLIFAVIAVKDKVDKTDATMSRIEMNQRDMNVKMDNWYERLVRVEERERERDKKDGDYR